MGIKPEDIKQSIDQDLPPFIFLPSLSAMSDPNTASHVIEERQPLPIFSYQQSAAFKRRVLKYRT